MPANPTNPTNLELVFIAWLDALRRRDLETLSDRLHPDVAWSGLRPGLRCRNRDEVLDVVASQPDLPAVEGLEMITAGEDRVVVGIRSPDLVEVAGEPLPGQVWEVFTVEDGLIVAIDEFPTREAAVRAAAGDGAASGQPPVTMLQDLLRRTHLSAPDQLGEVVADSARLMGAREVVIYVVDYEQRTLLPVPGPQAADREPLSIHGTMAGRAFRSITILDVEAPGGRRLWLPLVDGTERIGAMEMTFRAPERLPEAHVAACERYAHLVSMLLIGQAQFSDFYEALRRRREMTIASELLWGLVPPLVFATEDLVLAGLLEPCYDMGGDAFDYSLNDDTLHLGVFDAMGHGLAATGVAAFALAAYRHSRRRGDSLAETYRAIDAAVAEQYPTSRFVTALLAELDVSAGRLRWISAGHPSPLLLRGGRLIKTLHVPPAPPLGLQLAQGWPEEASESLEPGDLFLLYTDGLTEARRPDGELFTVERLGQFIERQAANAQPAPETLRLLREAIIANGAGALRDDATAVLVEWRRGTERVLVPQTV